MHAKAYYNENDAFAVSCLRQLIEAGCIAPGDVDDRSIEDVTPNDLKGYTQCHFFAGIAVWSYALRQAGWPDNRPVWTGSCPCQPFSAAGKGKGFADERHLWPAFHWLIGKCLPECIFGEQVAGKAGETWFDLVSTDLEMEGYACGAAVTAACGFGAPHQRKRLYWVADTASTRCERQIQDAEAETRNKARMLLLGSEQSPSSMADTTIQRPQRREQPRQRSRSQFQAAERASATGSMGKPRRLRCDDGKPGPTNGFWRDADWLGCRDGKWRPVEPGTFPLVDGAPARVGRLRGYGNAIVVAQAQAFIESYMEEACSRR